MGELVLIGTIGDVEFRGWHFDPKLNFQVGLAGEVWASETDPDEALQVTFL